MLARWAMLPIGWVGGYPMGVGVCYKLSPWNGAIAQLVERLHGMQEVWGSTPHGSTIDDGDNISIAAT